MVSIAATGARPERGGRGGVATPARQATACLLIIGNEILSGRTQDANLSILGKRCDALGERRAAVEAGLPLLRNPNGVQMEADWTVTVGRQYAPR